jgi:hypothetical protein
MLTIVVIDLLIAEAIGRISIGPAWLYSIGFEPQTFATITGISIVVFFAIYQYQY